MTLLDLLRAFFGLAITLGLIGLAAYVVRRYAPDLLGRLQNERKVRRLKVVETLVLDPSRRLVLVRIDDEERLILLGEGRELIEPRMTPEPAPQPPEPTVKAKRSGLPRVSSLQDLF